MILLLQNLEALPEIAASYDQVTAAAKELGTLQAVLIAMVLSNIALQGIDMWNRIRMEGRRNDLLMELNSGIRVLLDRKANQAE